MIFLAHNNPVLYRSDTVLVAKMSYKIVMLT